jgi:biopolymer transport protein ExbD
MILRLVDIVLIVLFGFMCISTIESQKRVELPQSTEIPATPPDTLENVTVSIDVRGQFFIRGEVTSSSYEEVESYIENAQKTVSASKKSLRLRIRADRSAPMHTVKWLTELCDALQIERSLIVVRNREQY